VTTTYPKTVLRHLRGLIAAESTGPMADVELLERFTARREEAAFTALVRRHGPMVHGVCRRLLHNWHDAEDAFQATFLALARSAGAVGRGGSVGGWLHRVAYHAAVKAKARAAHRDERERQVERRLVADPLAEVSGRELLAVLDEELHKLPERLREPLVLCYLEGKTRDEATRELNWSLGTLKRRLEQGRAALHTRLAGRGVAPVALLAAGIGTGAVSPALAAATTGAALLVVSGKQAVVPAGVGSLTTAALRALTAGPRRAVGAVLLAATLIATGAGLLAYRPPTPAATDPPPATAEAPDLRPTEPGVADKERMTVTGRVLDADGRPLAKAQVAVLAGVRRFLRTGAPCRPNVPCWVLARPTTRAASP
jgi:RNA polymerase sigma factor (sigma-70 family)